MVMINNGWNAAISAAIKSVREAPIFTREDLESRKDAEKLIILDLIEKRLEALKK